MDNAKPNATKPAFKWTLIYAAASIVLTYTVQLLGVDPTSSIKYVSYLIFIAFLLLAQKEYRDQLGGFITFGEGFMAGFMFSVFAGIFSAIFVYVYLTFLSPQIWEQTLTITQAKLQEAGTMSSDQIDTTMNITRKYGILIGSVFSIIGLIFIGAIVALIGAAIFKKERTLFDLERESIDPAV